MMSTSDSDDSVNRSARKLKRRRSQMRLKDDDGVSGEELELLPGTSSRKDPAIPRKQDTSHQKPGKRTRARALDFSSLSSSSDEDKEQRAPQMRLRTSALSPLPASNRNRDFQCDDGSSDEELECDDDGSSDEELKPGYQCSNDVYVPLNMPHRKKLKKLFSPLSEKSVMPNGDNKRAYCHDVNSEDEFEGAQSTKKKSTPTKKYPRYMDALLIPCLKKLSKEQINNQKVLPEWKHFYVKDMGPERENWRDCPCGKEGIRYLHYIWNKNTHCKTFVGSRCIDQFEESVKTIAKISKKLLSNGTNALLIAMNADGIARFKLNPNLALVKKRDMFIKDFNSIPVQMEGTDEDDPVYVLTADVADLNVNMEIGQDYKIRVQLKTNETNDLKAIVVDLNPIRRKTITPNDVKKFVRV